MQLKFHTQTSGESLTAQQPDNNIVRVAIQTMARYGWNSITTYKL